MKGRRLRLKSAMYRRAAWAYILLLPFLSAFALASFLPLPMLLLLGAIGWTFFTGRLKIIFEQWDLLLVGLIVLSLLAIYSAPSYVGPTTVKHTVALVGTIVMYYFCVRSLLLRVPIHRVVPHAITWMVVLLSCYVIFEFVVTNAYGVDIEAYVPHYRLGAHPNDATIFGLFIRPRGLAEEAGHSSLLYEIGLPLSYLYVRNLSWYQQVLYYALGLIAFFMLFSVGGIISLATATSVVGLLRLKGQYFRWIAVVILFGAFIYTVQPALVDSALFTISAKVQVGNEGSRSANTRLQAARKSWGIVREYPTGVGWGTIYDVRKDRRKIAQTIPPKSTISLVMEILVASGFIGLLVFIIFVLSKVFRLFSMKDEMTDALLVAMGSIALHYVFISNFWFPIPWFVFALTDVMWYRRTDIPSVQFVLR